MTVILIYYLISDIIYGYNDDDSGEKDTVDDKYINDSAEADSVKCYGKEIE